MNRKKLFVALAALLMNLACRLAVAEEIKVQLDWILGGKHVPFFVARDRGYFKGKGLDVRLLEGRGSLQPAQFVDTKQADYGYGDLVTAIEVMAKGGRNRAIGTGMVFQGGGYIFLEESGIKVPKDLEGKSFGTTPGDFGQVLLPALGAAAGFDHTKVIIKNIDAAVRTPAFFERKIDFLAGARGSSVPRMAIVAKRQNKKIGYLFFKDMGINSYGHVIQVHEERIKGNPDQIQRFMAALMDAWDWSINNPQQALEVFMTANPEKDREITLAEMQDGLGDIQDPETKQFGLGYMKEAMMKRSAELANKYAGLEKPVNYQMIYTNQFISKK
jgi:NitT/TauT family transport system substrate-binding protein